MAPPADVLAPVWISATIVFCSAVRQLPSRAPVQVGTSSFSLNWVWQAATSPTMPSVTPSSASHLARMRFDTSVRSAGVNAVPMSGTGKPPSQAGAVGEAVVVMGQPGHAHHGVAPAVGAAAEVRAVWRAAIGQLDGVLGHGCELLGRLVAVVQAGLRIETEGVVLCAGVAGIRADDRKALEQGAGHLHAR